MDVSSCNVSIFGAVLQSAQRFCTVLQSAQLLRLPF
jgi:hypothetical protein